MSPTSASKGRYYPALSGLRAVAVLIVFVHHYLAYVPGPFVHVAEYGWIGVDLFFVLSGFLITGNLYSSRNAPNRVRRFYWHRAMRIYPLFYAVLLAMLVFGTLVGVHWRPLQLLYPLNLGNYAMYLSNPPSQVGIDTLFPTLAHSTHLRPLFLGHLWSLCLEEQFYFVWPFVVFGIRSRRTLLRVCVGILVVAPVLRFLACLYLPTSWVTQGFVYRALPLRCDALAFGAVLALLRQGPQWEKLLRWHRLLLPLGVLLVALPGIVLALQGESLFPFQTPWTAALGFSVVDLGAAAVILALTAERSLGVRLLSLPWLTGLGTVSYAFYVFHDIPKLYYLEVAHRIAPTHWVSGMCLLGLVATVLLSMASWRFFESVFLRYKHRYDAPKAAPATLPTVAAT